MQLDVEKDILVLSVNKNDKKDEEKEEAGVKWHHTERSHVFMKRSLRLPDTVDTNSVSAAYKDGVLSITIRKRETPAPKKVTIA